VDCWIILKVIETAKYLTALAYKAKDGIHEPSISRVPFKDLFIDSLVDYFAILTILIILQVSLRGSYFFTW